MTAAPVIAAEQLTRDFPGVRALDGVDLGFEPGEVHGLIGENGAGKSTLMNILAGVHQPTFGQLRLDGQPVSLPSPADAIERGVAMIHQELNLVDELTVSENIFLGREPTRAGFIDYATMNQRSGELLDRLSCDIDPATPLHRLSIAQQQMVEIAKALSIDARVLIMDEPTAVINRAQTRVLFDVIARLRASGVTVIYISHILDEVLEICDRVTVLRDGQVVTTLDREQVKAATEQHLAGLMVGRPMADHFPPLQACGEDQVFAVSGLCTTPHVSDVSFGVREREILGLAGLIGAGRTETAEAIVGLRPRLNGQITCEGQPLRIRSLSDAVDQGIAYLSEDRKGSGLTLGMSITANSTLVSLRRYCHPFINRTEEQEAVDGHVGRLNIKVASTRDDVTSLSGGNQQKVALAKWLETRPRVLILDEPTRGVDIGAKEEIYRLIQQLAGQGMACIMISSELNELLGMCHRIGVMRQGRLLEVIDGPTATEEQIMQIAAGVSS